MCRASIAANCGASIPQRRTLAVLSAGLRLPCPCHRSDARSGTRASPRRSSGWRCGRAPQRAIDRRKRASARSPSNAGAAAASSGRRSAFASAALVRAGKQHAEVAQDRRQARAAGAPSSSRSRPAAAHPAPWRRSSRRRRIAVDAPRRLAAVPSAASRASTKSSVPPSSARRCCRPAADAAACASRLRDTRGRASAPSATSAGDNRPEPQPLAARPHRRQQHVGPRRHQHEHRRRTAAPRASSAARSALRASPRPPRR